MIRRGTGIQGRPSQSTARFNHSRSLESRLFLEDCTVGGTASTLAKSASGFSSLIADVGCITVTIGRHRTSVNLGIGLPHSKHCSRSSGFTVPQCEQYTGLRIEPQWMQYLPFPMSRFLQEGHAAERSAIVKFSFRGKINLTVKQGFRR